MLVFALFSANNKRLWNDLGIKHARDNVLQAQPIQHPSDPSRKLEVMPDSVHVYKSMVQGWINNKVIYLPESTVKAEGLSTNVADITHLTDLVLYEEKCDLKMACGLRKEDVDFTKPVSNFEKMKVKNSQKYVNHTVAAALRVYAANSGRTDVLTTAYLIDALALWYTYITARSRDMALSLVNEEAYEKAIEFLTNFQRLVYSIRVGSQRFWKPWQSAAIMVTKSILRLTDYFLRHRGYEFVLGGRFTQDCLENIFSQLRKRQIRPTALQVKDSLKLLTVSQYMTDVNNSSYLWDSCDWLLSFPDHLKDLSTTANVQINEIEDDGLIDVFLEENVSIESSEQNVVYYLSGMILRQISIQSNACSKCIGSCMADNAPTDNISTFTCLKDYTGSSLLYVNIETYNFFIRLEQIFKQNIEVLKLVNHDLETKLYALMSHIQADHIPDCHEIKNKLIKRYIQFRLKVSREKRTREKRHDSKSMAI